MTKTVELKTSMGNLRIELDDDKAPVSVENFLSYVRSGHYNGTVFHRVISGFMVQGGGMEPGMQQKPTQAPIQNEAANGLKNLKYTLAMARTNAPHSATSQFFINTVDNAFLDYQGEHQWGYAVFGKVVAGTEVVDAMEAVPTGRKGMHADVPKDDLLILEATEL